MRKTKILILTAVLILNGLLFTACGDKTKATLDRVGSVSKILARGYNDQIIALKAGNADSAKLVTAERLGKTLTITTNALSDYLASLKDVNENNAAEVSQKIGLALGTVNQILLNPDVQAIDANSKFAQILGWASTGFTVATTTLAALFPQKTPGAVGVSSVGSKPIPASKITFDIPAPPPAVVELLRKG